MTFRKIAITIIAAFENRDYRDNRDFTIIAIIAIIAMNDTINDDFMFLRKFCVIKVLTLSQTFIFRTSI